MGKVRQLTGAKSQKKASRKAAAAQKEATDKGIEFQREALKQIRGDLSPFRSFGIGALGSLGQELGIPASRPSRGPSRQFSRIMPKDRRRWGVGDFGGVAEPGGGFQLDMDPSRVLDDPFFQALAGQQEQRLLASAAARGRVGAGGTSDILQENLLQLGSQFRQQDIQNQLAAQQQRFGQLFNVATLGANAAAQTGTATQNTAGAVSNLMTQGANAQASGIIGAANAQAAGNQQVLDLITTDILQENLLQLGSQFRQQDIQNQLAAQQQRFGQLFNVATLGANAAAQTGTATQNTAGAVSNLMTQGANAQASGIIGAANAQAAGNQQVLDLITTGAAMIFSDERLKENKVAMRVDDDGLVVYEFNYKGDSTRYEGKMAQDIQKVDPEAVTETDEGYLMVSDKYAPRAK